MSQWGRIPAEVAHKLISGCYEVYLYNCVRLVVIRANGTVDR